MRKINKKLIYSSLALIGISSIVVGTYFSQNAYYYNMFKIEKTKDDINSVNSYSSKILSKHKRVVPKTYVDPILPSNVNPVDFYPSYYFAQKDISIQTKIVESYNTSKWLDVEWIKNEISNNSLKQHPAAKYQYETFVDKNVMAVKKMFNVNIDYSGYITTGLFIPPGEVFTISFPNLTDEQVKNLKLSVVVAGTEEQSGSEGSASAMPKWQKRMPWMKKNVEIDKNNFQFGTPFGGLINIASSLNNNFEGEKNILFTIDGAVEAVHYIHGYTTEKEWNRLLNEAKAPVFDFKTDFMEFLGGISVLNNQYENKLPYPFKTMELFRKMSSSSYYAIADNNNGTQAVRMTYSNYVPAGAAVSFVRAFFVMAPLSWTEKLLDYDYTVAHGSWGNMHEFNHQNQGSKKNGKWGFEGETEVTNNTLNVASYIDYLDVLGNRINQNSLGLDVNWHEWKVNGFLALRELNKNVTTPNKNANDFIYTAYMTLFGTESYYNAIRWYSEPLNVKDYKNQTITPPATLNRNSKFTYVLSKIVGYDLSYFYSKFINFFPKAVEGVSEPSSNSESSDFKALQESLKDLKPISPAYNFFASDVKVDDNDYQHIGSSYKVDSEKETILNIEEHTNSNNDITINNFQLVSQPKYGSITETKDENNKIAYKYIPKIKTNQIDEFEFSVDSQNTNVANSKTKITFKVKLVQKDSGYVFESPQTKDYINFLKQKQNIDLSNSFKSINIEDEKNNEEVSNLIKPDIPSDTLTDWESKPSAHKVFMIDLKNNETFNNFTIYSRRVWDYENPDTIKIEAYADNSWKELYNGKFILSTTGSYSFNPISTNKIRITIDASRNKAFRFRRFKINSLLNANNIISPNSDLINLKGSWKKGFEDGSINSSNLFSIDAYTELDFSFYGKGFSIVANTDNWYGNFEVYIDNKFSKKVSLKSSSRSLNKVVYVENNLEDKEHKVTIRKTDWKPIDISYFSIDGNKLNKQYDNSLYYFQTIGLPIMLIVPLLVSLILIYVYRNKIFKFNKVKNDNSKNIIEEDKKTKEAKPKNNNSKKNKNK